MMSRRRRLLVFLACLLLAPSLLGAYYPSCSKTTIGFWPNYPIRSATDLNAVTRATDAQIKGTVLFVNWDNRFYNCPLGLCTVSACSGGACTINTTQLTNHIKPFLDKWVHKSELSLNLEIVFIMHTAGFGNPAVGPGHIQPLGVTSPTTRAAFKSFFDAVFAIIKSANYNDQTGAYWLFSIGNEVNLYLQSNQTAWNDYTSFYNEVKTHIHDPVHSGVARLVGVSTTFFGTTNAPGFWNISGTPPLDLPDQFTGPRIRTLNLTSDAIIFTYYPVNPEQGYRALNPNRVAGDFFWMDLFAWGLDKQVVIQEFGYPTDSALHGSSDPFYSTYSDGEQAQVQFVTNVMDAIEDPQYDPDYTIIAASWWSLFDVGSPTATSGDCFNLAGTFGQQSNVPFKRWLCTMGLVRADNTNKPAWTTFKNRAIDAPNW